MQGEGCFGDNAVHAFLLHAGQAAQSLVGHILAQAGQAYFVPFQFNHTAHAAGRVPYLKHCRFFRQNFMARMIDALHVNDFSCGRDHAPGKQVIQGGAVFKGKGAAGIFRHVAANGGGCFGSRVHGKEQAFLCGSIDGVLGDDARLAVQGKMLPVHGHGREPRHVHDHAALEHGHGSAGHAGTASARNEGELHIVGQTHQRADLFRGCGFDN